MTRSRTECAAVSAGRHRGDVIGPLVAFAVLLAAAAAAADAGAGDPAGGLSDADRLCLSCHEAGGMEKVLGDGTTLSLDVPAEAFANSVHAWAGCAGCHEGVDLAAHPGDREIESARAYAAQASQACSTCHTGESLRDGPAHHAGFTGDGNAACSACHDAHAIAPVAEWKAALDETAYCQACHGRGADAVADGGRPTVPSVDEAALRRSAHPDHECTWCHADYSLAAHPPMAAEGSRQTGVAPAEVCRTCHEEKYQQYQGSIHAALARSGDPAAPVCSDCHGAHAIGPKATYETIAGVPCRNCHQDIFDAYLDSTHGKARDQTGHIAAPICADCHRAHEVGVASTGTRLRDACLACHDDAAASHRAWLPNTALHFEAVSCPACHAPLARRRIDLALYDAAAQAPLALSPELPPFEDRLRSVAAEGAGMSAMELWNLVRDIGRGDGAVEAVLRGRMEVQSGVEAHQLADRTQAVRNCDSCHSNRADPFQTVTVSIVRPDGRPLHFAARPEVLDSPVSVGSVRGFYAIGGTRIRFLDILLVLAVLGGVTVPVAHMAMRRILRKDETRGDGR